MGYAVVPGRGAGQLFDWNITLAVLGLGAVVYSLSGFWSRYASGLERTALIAAITLPTYVVLQLIPLPLLVLRIFDPTRAEVAGALGSVIAPSRVAPLSLSPIFTWWQLSHVAGCTLVFFLVRQVARGRSTMWWSALPLLAIGGFEAALGLAQQSNGAGTVSGTYFNKDHFAGLLEMILPFAIICVPALLERRHAGGAFAVASAIKAPGLLVLSIVIFAAITASLSKAGFVSMIVSLFTMAAVALEIRLSGRKKWTAAAALAVLSLLVFVLVPPNEMVEAFGVVSSDPTAEGRWPIAKDTLRMIAAYPLTGVGLGAYYSGLQRYQTYGFDLAWLYAHNDYLQLLSELGIIGFLVAASLLYCVLVLSVRAARSLRSAETRHLGLACTGGVTAILFHSFFDFNLYEPANAMVLSWISGIAIALPAPAREENSRIPDSNRRFIRLLTFAIGCLTTLYAGIWLIYLQSFSDDVKLWRVFCRFGVCDPNKALTALERKQGGETALVPPAELAEFLQMNPAEPYNWSLLSESLRRTGRFNEARVCIERALSLGGRQPGTLFSAAQFHFSMGERNEGIKLMKRALGGSSNQRQLFLREYDRWHVSIEEVLSSGLPAHPQIWRDYFHYQIRHAQVSDVTTVWKALVARGYGDNRCANELVEFLLLNKQSETAESAWALYAGTRDQDYPDSNLVFNGDFELEPTGSRFDWTIEQTPGAAIRFDRQTAHAGSRSLRIQFDGKRNVGEIGVRQSVYLKPGRYQFQAYVRAQEISTDEGVEFRITSEPPAKLNLATEAVRGTTDWKLVKSSFQVPPGTGLIEVRLARKPSLRFDNLVRGTLWVDEVSIRPAPSR